MDQKKNDSTQTPHVGQTEGRDNELKQQEQSDVVVYPAGGRKRTQDDKKEGKHIPYYGGIAISVSVKCQISRELWPVVARSYCRW